MQAPLSPSFRSILKNALGEGPSLARTLVNASMYYNMLQFAATVIPLCHFVQNRTDAIRASEAGACLCS